MTIEVSYTIFVGKVLSLLKGLNKLFSKIIISSPSITPSVSLLSSPTPSPSTTPDIGIDVRFIN